MIENYITHLYSQDIGVFEKLDIKFNKRFNFIIGPNGCGKTSILKCIALAVNQDNINEFRYGENPAVWIDTINNNQKYRIGANGWVVNNKSEYRKATNRRFNRPPEDNEFTAFVPYDLNESKVNITPLFLGAYRRIEYRQLNGVAREKGIYEQRNDYRRNGMNNLKGGSLPNVKQWMINRYFILDKEWAKPYRKNWNWIIDNLDKLSPLNSKLQFKVIKNDLEPVFSLDGIDCYLEEISAGFQSILSIVFAIVEWIEATNEENDFFIPEATGTVVIDELDAHLHPEWQLTIRNSLAEIFPNLQFIITTHSPHLIASANPGELIILPKLERKLENIVPFSGDYSGWETDEILKDVMYVDGLENRHYNKLIEKASSCVANKDKIGLKAVIEELKKVVHPSNTILSVLNIELAKLELENH